VLHKAIQSPPPARRLNRGGVGGGGSSSVYRPPRGRGRLAHSWDSERPAWADAPVDKDQPKGRFRGGRFRADSEGEEGFSSGSEGEGSEEEKAAGWEYKDPQNITRGTALPN